MAGLYHIPIRSIAKDILMDESVVFSVIDSLVEIGFCKYDHADEYCWVIGAALEELGENPSRQQIVGLQNLITRLVIDEYAPFAEELSKLIFSIPEFQAKLEEPRSPDSPPSPQVIDASSSFHVGKSLDGFLAHKNGRGSG